MGALVQAVGRCARLQLLHSCLAHQPSFVCALAFEEEGEVTATEAAMELLSLKREPGVSAAQAHHCRQLPQLDPCRP
jgi:hypothetical protein